jgi:hypothetical protein
MQTIGSANRQLVFLAIALLIVSCARIEMAAPPTPARDVLFSGQEAPLGFGAYGYLIFTKRPTENNLDRYEAVCNAFIGNLEPVYSYPKSIYPSIMPTYWLSQDKEKINRRYPDCQQWVEFYDYPRAKTIASAVEVLSSKGPMAWGRAKVTCCNDMRNSKNNP